MNAVIYYSNTLQSYKVAEYISQKTSFGLVDINNIKGQTFDLIYLVFPVHYQSVPKCIKPLIKCIKTNKAILIATYGKMGFGHVLNDVSKLLKAKVIGGAYVPTKHAYKPDDKSFDDFQLLEPLIARCSSEEQITIPKGQKNIFADFFPLTRHRLAVKISPNTNCIKCGKCNDVCPFINNGIINNKKCIRCLKCVNSCDLKALTVKLSSSLKKYLNKKRMTKLIVY